jgi:hypothetical protein
MSWMKVTMSHKVANAGGHKRVMDAFDAALMAAGNPENAALFSNRPTEKDCVFYFSPGAVNIFSSQLVLMDAEKCEAPPSVGTISLIGNGDPFAMLK